MGEVISPAGGSPRDLPPDLIAQQGKPDCHVRGVFDSQSRETALPVLEILLEGSEGLVEIGVWRRRVGGFGLGQSFGGKGTDAGPQSREVLS